MADLVPVDQTWRSILYTPTFAHPRLIGLVESYLRALDDLEATLAAMQVGMTSIEDALGAQLLTLARIVGAPIYTGQDELTRVAVRSEILVRRSSGTGPDLIAIADALFPDQVVALVELFPATVLVGPAYSLSADVAAVSLSALRRGKAAGVRIDLLWSPEPEANTFAFSETDSPQADAARGFADALNPGTGGALAGIA